MWLPYLQLGSPSEVPPKGRGMSPYPWTHVRIPSLPGHLDWPGATLPSNEGPYQDRPPLCPFRL